MNLEENLKKRRIISSSVSSELNENPNIISVIRKSLNDFVDAGSKKISLHLQKSKVQKSNTNDQISEKKMGVEPDLNHSIIASLSENNLAQYKLEKKGESSQSIYENDWDYDINNNICETSKFEKSFLEEIEEINEVENFSKKIKEFIEFQENIMDLKESDSINSINNRSNLKKKSFILPYKCDQCEKNFNTKRGLNIHQSWHQKNVKKSNDTNIETVLANVTTQETISDSVKVFSESYQVLKNIIHDKEM